MAAELFQWSFVRAMMSPAIVARLSRGEEAPTVVPGSAGQGPPPRLLAGLRAAADALWRLLAGQGARSGEDAVLRYVNAWGVPDLGALPQDAGRTVEEQAHSPPGNAAPAEESAERPKVGGRPSHGESVVPPPFPAARRSPATLGFDPELVSLAAEHWQSR